ncbi:MAG: FAD:protein FMN transferase [Erysipelotrichaceae bacterium]
MKKIVRFSRVLCQILLVGALLIAFGCQKETTRDKPIGKVSYNYFDTVSYVYDYTNDTDKEFEQFSNGVFDILAYYHQLFDIYHDYSGINNLKTINDQAGISPVEVDQQLIDFLLYCKEMYTLTSGKMNVMLGSVLTLWHDCRSAAADDPSNSKIPEIELLQQAGEHTSIDSLVIDEINKTVYISDSQASIDVGAVGKGYATEKAAQYLIENGKDGYVLNIGGNIRTIGTKPNGDSWVTGIKNPNDPDGDFPIRISISNISCVTSGVYERYFTVDGKRYHHIIDSDTLFPADYFASLTILADDSGLADSLSTALFCCDEQTGRDILSKMPQVGAIWIYSDGKVSYTENVKELIVD